MTKLPLTKLPLTETLNKDIMNIRLECIKIAYTSVYTIDDVIQKATAIENYILGRDTPDKDKVKV